MYIKLYTHWYKLRQWISVLTLKCFKKFMLTMVHQTIERSDLQNHSPSVWKHPGQTPNWHRRVESPGLTHDEVSPITTCCFVTLIYINTSVPSRQRVHLPTGDKENHWLKSVSFRADWTTLDLYNDKPRTPKLKACPLWFLWSAGFSIWRFQTLPWGRPENCEAPNLQIGSA